MPTSRPPNKSLPPKRPKSRSSSGTTRPASPRAKAKSSSKSVSARPRWLRWLALAAAATLFVTTLALTTAGFVLWYFSRGLPSAESLHQYAPAQTTRLVDRNGELIGEVFFERRTVVPMSRIPRVLVLSVLAAEDADFYHHSGMDLPGMARILWKAVVNRRATQGGSTITQQVVKNLLLTPERTLSRKLKELILSRRIEQELTKDEILFLYLNQINFGHARYGVQEASRFYFGKDVEKLNLAEASLIAGIPQSPSYLSPRTHPEAARKRQSFVLDQLERKHDLYWDDLPLDEIKRARKALPELSPLPDLSERAPEVAQLAKQVLVEAVGADKAQRGGYTVTTSIDLALERKARAALRAGIDGVKTRLGKRAKSRPDGAVLVLDWRTREVLALVGGYEAISGFNRATQAERQPGSTFKPLVYALGIKSRRFTPATQVIDAPGVFDQYKPGNYETWSYAGPVRIRHGLAQSINLVAIRVIEELTAPAVVTFAQQLGIDTKLEPTLPLALGASGVRLSELTNAYATFAAGGRFAPLKIVKKIVDASGRSVALPKQEPAREVLTAAESYVMTSLLSSVVQEGTGARAKVLDRAVAGKTGTSNQARDAWFVGYTAQLVGGVWVGFDDYRALGAKESGGKTALPIWIDVMKAAHAELKPVPFTMPGGVVTARIDPGTGVLAYEGQTDGIDEVFLEGTVPSETARPPDVADPTTFMMEQLGGTGAE